MVSVDYADLLAITLPYNRHHFSEIWVVTSSADEQTKAVAQAHGAHVFVTDSFYANGAAFNKWLALEEGLDAMGREGWLCLMDADVLWPKGASVGEIIRGTMSFSILHGSMVESIVTQPGQLCSPLRRMWNHWPLVAGFPGTVERIEDTDFWLPLESDWSKFPIHRNVNEWAGYSQIFHTSDPVLGPPPWHQVDWKHAGGADSFFQQKWKPENKVRPPFEVLHLGPAGQNWFGRATPRLDGTVPPDADGRRASCAAIWPKRRTLRAEGLDQFDGERTNEKTPPQG